MTGLSLANALVQKGVVLGGKGLRNKGTMILGISKEAVKALSPIIFAVKRRVVCAGRILYTMCNFMHKTSTTFLS